ncbi:unnamed protein product [Vitrella brassicaformis CCMP3155]|uniref:Uncharacterized protein n=1 Tax=Vitrella brassicaformis (strain CCMP3155) TaxID=1169540 RepID=A0A0G4F1B4_VITBC|nr:unnamed protein product [Vitrella brassicaformis CCMP3155]|eukprot:CEM05681.1 unnamed protein product [Vitrella brassicaformis CCMP3155]
MPLYLILAWVSLISSATEASASAAVFHCKVGLLCTLRLQESHSTGAEVVNEIVLSSSPCENLLAVTTELLGITAIRGDNGGQFRLGEPRSTGRFELCWYAIPIARSLTILEIMSPGVAALARTGAAPALAN